MTVVGINEAGLAKELAGTSSSSSSSSSSPSCWGVLHIDGSEAEHAVRGEEFVIGRNYKKTAAAGAEQPLDMALEEMEVSARHCKLLPPSTSDSTSLATLQDAGSTNGTYVDGKKVPDGARVALKDGAEISFRKPGGRSTTTLTIPLTDLGTHKVGVAVTQGEGGASGTLRKALTRGATTTVFMKTKSRIAPFNTNHPISVGGVLHDKAVPSEVTTKKKHVLRLIFHHRGLARSLRNWFEAPKDETAIAAALEEWVDERVAAYPPYDTGRTVVDGGGGGSETSDGGNSASVESSSDGGGGESDGGGGDAGGGRAASLFAWIPETYDSGECLNLLIPAPPAGTGAESS